jgi:hypothetical protein
MALAIFCHQQGALLPPMLRTQPPAPVLALIRIAVSRVSYRVCLARRACRVVWCMHR